MTEVAIDGSWRRLLGRGHRGPMTVLAGGVVLYATNVYLTTSLLPSAVAEIGGERFYAWTTTAFLLASVASSVLVSRLLVVAGPRAASLTALGLFGAGSLVCAVSPAMVVLLVGRGVQGLGGGLLAGLAYALIRSTLPEALWARGSALVSAMWGVGTFVGPAAGGLFAQVGLWRLAFVALVVATAGIAAVVVASLGGDRTPAAREPFPAVSLLLVTSAAAAVSVASVIGTVPAGAAGIAVSVVLLGLFLRHERRSTAGVLPRATFSSRRLRAIYVTIAVLAVGSTVETFVPLFGQRLAGLAPLAAGFLGAALAAGWTLGELPSASAERARTSRRLLRVAPGVLAVGLVGTAVAQRAGAGPVTVVLGALALVVAGAGIGVAWPHLATAAMATHDIDVGDGDRAAAGINTVQLLANTLGAALTGLLVNLGEPDPVRAAHLLFGGIAVVALLGVPAAWRAARA